MKSWLATRELAIGSAIDKRPVEKNRAPTKTLITIQNLLHMRVDIINQWVKGGLFYNAGTTYIWKENMWGVGILPRLNQNTDRLKA